MNAVETLARIAEVTIGIGIPPVDGCKLCRRPIPCPTHLGRAIAQAILADPDACRAIAAEVVEPVLEKRAFFIPSEYADDALVYVEHVRAALRGDQS